MSGDTLTVYASAPAHGASAAAGTAAVAGARRALRDSGGRAGGRRVRLVPLSSTRPGDAAWDPGTVEAGAERATDDPTSIAYLGELDGGASAVSLPVTNRGGLLQVSPADGLTSLTATPPGRPRAGPERYYPKGRRSFVRLVPSDLEVADAMLALARGTGARRVAIVHTEGFAERELAGMLAIRLRRREEPPVLLEPVRGDEDAAASLVEDLTAERAEAILFAGVDGEEARALLAALAAGAAGVPVVGSPGLADAGALRSTPSSTSAVTGVLPPRAQPPRGRRLLRSLARGRPQAGRPESLYGYDAMRLVLDAVDAAGPDRRGVVRAALEPRPRSGATGRYAVLRNGAVRGRPLALVELNGTGPVLRRLLP